MKVLILALILCLIIPATAYSQIADLNNVSTTTQKQKPVSTQCLDFNQDGICESIVLANGTIIKNPDLPMAVSITNNNTTTNNSTMIDKGNSTAQNVTVTIAGKTVNAAELEWAQENCYNGYHIRDDGVVDCNPVESDSNSNDDEESIPWNEPWEESGDSDNDNDNDNDNLPDCEDVALSDYVGKCESDSGAKLPLCSVMEEQGRNVGCWDDEDRPESTEKEKEEAEDKGIGCQPEDDYCDYDEGCESIVVDCIDDVNKGDDGEDSDPDDDEEGEEDQNGDNLFG